MQAAGIKPTVKSKGKVAGSFKLFGILLIVSVRRPFRGGYGSRQEWVHEKGRHRCSSSWNGWDDSGSYGDRLKIARKRVRAVLTEEDISSSSRQVMSSYIGPRELTLTLRNYLSLPLNNQLRRRPGSLRPIFVLEVRKVTEQNLDSSSS